MATRLLLLNLQYPLLIGLWLFLALVFSGKIGVLFGMHYLVLHPEYLSRVWFWSFFLLGGSMGFFTTCYQITCYILYGNRYPFLLLLDYPFLKFCINNSLLPLLFHVYFVLSIFFFQLESASFWLVGLRVLGYVVGLGCVIVVVYCYFFWIRIDVGKKISTRVDRPLKRWRFNRARIMRRIRAMRQVPPRVLLSYWDEHFCLRQASQVKPGQVSSGMLSILNKGHVNALLVQGFIISVLFVLGFFNHRPHLQLPAGASGMLLISFVVMLVGAFVYWFKSWGALVLIVMAVLIDVVVSRRWVDATHTIAGLDYSVPQRLYNDSTLLGMIDSLPVEEDKQRMLGLLNNWRARQDSLPIMVLAGVSGGGTRAALWTARALQQSDSVLQGRLIPQTVLVTGASGGMIGAAYFRELYAMRQQHPRAWLHDPANLEALSKDCLNSVIFAGLSNEVFLQPHKHWYANQPYFYDRGYALEDCLNENTQQIWENKTLKSYHQAEYAGEIPMLWLSPTIINDGRRLYLSAQGLSFMAQTQADPVLSNGVTGIDFFRFFQHQQADSLRFLSALRLNSSFPYILPSVRLPTDPPIFLTDAGIRDNYGVEDMLKFLYLFRGWIKVHTRMVVLLLIRDGGGVQIDFAQENGPIFRQAVTPLSSISASITKVQDLRHQTHIEQLQNLLGIDLRVVTLYYSPDFPNEPRASLSLHLTNFEKQSILKSIQKPNNVQALQQLKKLMSPKIKQ